MLPARSVLPVTQSNETPGLLKRPKDGAPAVPAASSNAPVPDVTATVPQPEAIVDSVPVNQPVTDGNLPVIPSVDLVGNGAGNSKVEQLAFAVTVQPATLAGTSTRVPDDGSVRSVVPTSRHAATSTSTRGDLEGVPHSSQDSIVQTVGRFQGQVRDNGGDRDSAAGELAAGKSLQKKSTPGPDSTQSPGSAEGSLPSGNVPVSDERALASTEATGKAGSSPASAPVAAGDSITTEQKVTPGMRPKDISVRVQSDEGQSVDIRIVQRGGGLQIAVKSADNDTTQGLRHGLSELANRLNDSGYHAETWRPGASAPTDSSAGSGGSPQQHPSSSDSQSNSGWSQQNRGQRDNNQPNRPRWIQELESNLTSETSPTGQFHGLIR